MTEPSTSKVKAVVRVRIEDYDHDVADCPDAVDGRHGCGRPISVQEHEEEVMIDAWSDDGWFDAHASGDAR